MSKQLNLYRTELLKSRVSLDVRDFFYTIIPDFNPQI